MKTSPVVSAELAQTVPARGDPLDCPDPIRPRVITRDGVQLAVRDYGPRSAGHTVVFLHGFCLTHASWARHIQYLVRRYGDGIRVIAYDHRGHGDSAGAPMHTYRIDQLATDLADVLLALNVVGPVTLVGHSMGGMAALAYLGLAPADRPVEPDGLVLVATAAGKLAQRGLGRLLATAHATTALYRLVDHAPHQAIKALAGPILAALNRQGDTGNTQRATLAALAAAALATTPLSTAVGFLPALYSYDQYQTLDSIRAHTVIVSGGADVLTPPAHSHELAAAIPDATHVHIPHAGHMLTHDATHIINDAIGRTMTIPREINLYAAAGNRQAVGTA